MTIFSGSLVALVSPMKDDGSIDWDCLANLIEWHIQSKTDGIVAVGTTGESPTLNFDEHRRYIKETVKLVAGRIPVIAGTGANSTAEAIELTEDACNNGVDACLSVVPYYNKPTQHGLIKHYQAIADKATKPVILYNVPSRTIVGIDNETLLTLSSHKMITGIKDATGEIDRLKWQQERIDPETFLFTSGDDGTACEYIKNGGHGVISVTANIAPTMFHEMVANASSGKHAEADAIDTKLAVFNDVQSLESNPIPLKWAMHHAGKIGANIRLPLTTLSDEFKPAIEKAIENLY